MKISQLHRRNSDWKPSFTTFYRLGVLLSKRMRPVGTLRAIAKEFRTTPQNVYTMSVVALGKVAFQLAREVHLKPIDTHRPAA